MQVGIARFVAIILISLSTVAGFAAQRPAFEVASIRLDTLTNTRQDKTITRDGINYSRVTVFDCIMDAYHIAGFQISGDGDFRDVLSRRYDIVAKAGHESDKAELMSMLQSLLADRFQLQIHRDTKDAPVYFLMKGNKRLSITQVDDQGGAGFHVGPDAIAFRQTSMFGLAAFLAGLGSIERPVLDRTSLPGVYDFTLSRTDAEAADDKRAQGAGTPSIFQDVQDIGLKLESARAPVEMLVIDHVEKASAN